MPDWEGKTKEGDMITIKSKGDGLSSPGPCVPADVYHSTTEITSDNALSLFPPPSCSLVIHPRGGGVTSSQEADSGPKLDTIAYPVTTLNSHGHTVIEL